MAVPADQMSGLPREWQQLLFTGTQKQAPLIATADEESVQRIMQLLAWVDQPNIVDDLSEQDRTRLAALVCREYEIDDESRGEWISDYEEGLKLAEQAIEKKSYPWDGAANIKYPALTKASILFNARAMPALIQGTRVARAQVIGQDADGAKEDRKERIEAHMNYQLLHEMEEWQEGTDRLLLVNPMVGTTFRKTFYDATLGRPVSDLVMAKDLVVNYHAPSFERAPRKTHCYELYPHEIIERQTTGAFADVNLDLTTGEDGDEGAPHRFLEQHRRYDMDDDGYPEPWIVTVHERTKKIVRVSAGYDEDGIDVSPSGDILRIEQITYFTKYGFIPNPRSSTYDWGYYHIMRSLQGAMDTSMNQTLDAAHLANAPGGWIGKELRIRGGSVRKRPGEYKMVPVAGDDIRRAVVTDQFSGPSPAMLSIIEFLKSEMDDLSSVQDVLQGDMPANAQPTTVQALIEQGLQPFRAVFKRIHRSLGKELGKLYRLNRKFLEPEQYFRVLDTGEPAQVWLEDYAAEDMDIVPVSDPKMVSDQERLIKAQAKMALLGSQLPFLNAPKIIEDYLEALKVESPEQYFVEPQQGPTPEEQAVAAQLQQKQQEVDVKMREQALKEEMAPFERLKTLGDAYKAIAQAEGEEEGRQMDQYRMVLERMDRELKRVEIENAEREQRAMGRMARKPGN